MKQKRTRIKVCGITSIEDSYDCIDAGIDALGFIHYPVSKRHIGIDKIYQICKNLPPFVSLIALLVDPSKQLVEDIRNNTPIDCLQFHGSETAESLAEIKMPYYKKVSLDSISFDVAANTYKAANALLADTPTQHGSIPGGTGRVFDWQLTKRTSAKPLILAGGLNPDNIAQAIEQCRPYAVDVNSGVEIRPGKKDKEKIQQLMLALKQADQSLYKS